MSRIVFAIVGGGWRAMFYLRVARALPEVFEVCAVVEQNAERAKWIHRTWDVPVYSTLEEMEGFQKPGFLALCLPQGVLSDYIAYAANRGYHVLSETYCPRGEEAVRALYSSIGDKHRVQFSEQYFRQSLHAARLNLLKTGILGDPTQVQISVAHLYHGISLLRLYLGVGFENCEIQGRILSNPVVQGPGREGYPDSERLVEDRQQLALYRFDGKWALFDFTEEQYFSRIRNHRVLVRGERGEMLNNAVYCLADHRTPVEFSLVPVYSGQGGSMGGPFIECVTGRGEVLYRNPFPGARLSDDELAVAQTLCCMGQYICGGEAAYSLEDACQDMYLSNKMLQAFESGRAVQTQTQPWA